MTVVFQPVFDVAAGAQVVGAEALVRWHHEQYGHIAPPDIVEAARSADLLSALNRYILRAACSAAAAWRVIDPERRCFVAVNASPEEIASPDLVEHVREAVAEHALPTADLYIEISERLVSPAPESVLANVAALRSLGVGLLLDDFGQGNTSLSYLHELPLSGIKLDRRLVVNALRSESDRIVLQSIIGLSRQLGHLVIAEGVETAEHLDAVVAAGCTLAQGFHLGRPQPADQLEQLVRSGARPGQGSQVIDVRLPPPIVVASPSDGYADAPLAAPVVSAERRVSGSGVG